MIFSALTISSSLCAPGLIYGIGHAVYSVSDPRAEIFKKFVEELAEEKGESNLVVKEELLPPPCSICSTNAKSKTAASIFVYLNLRRKKENPKNFSFI